MCKDGFVFKNGLCRFDDSNCLVALNDTCKQCVEGYQFSVQKNTCVLNSFNNSSSSSGSSSSTATTKPVTNSTSSSSTTTNNKI